MSSLAAARADNFYYAPDFDPDKHGTLNKYNGQHALRDRAKNIDKGILVIRFEVPFHIWCTKCGEKIAQGERFNADKRGIGHYHSTRIWQFSMRHHCGCIITIQSDPKHCDYIVVEGAKKKVEGVQSAAEAGVIELTDDAEKERLLKDPIYRVEAGEASRKRARSAAEEVADLLEDAQAKHADPYAVNRVLRAKLRAVKQEEAALDAEHKALNLAEEVRLLPSSEADATAASLAFFAHDTGGLAAQEAQASQRTSILNQSIFSSKWRQGPVLMPPDLPPPGAATTGAGRLLTAQGPQATLGLKHTAEGHAAPPAGRSAGQQQQQQPQGPAWATVVRRGPEEVAGGPGLGSEARQAIQLGVGQGGGPSSSSSSSKSRTHRRVLSHPQSPPETQQQQQDQQAGLGGRGDAHERQGAAGGLPAALLLNSLVPPAEPVVKLSSGAGRLLQPPPAGHQSAGPALQGAGHASSLPPVGHKLMAHLHSGRSAPRCASERDGPGPEEIGLAPALAEAVGAAGGGSNGGQGLALCKVQHPWSGPAGTAGSSLARKREAAAAAVAKLHRSAEAAHNSAVKAVAAWTASRQHGKVKGKPADGAKPLERKDVLAMKSPGTTASLSYKAALLAQRRSTPGVIARHHPA